MGRQGSRVCRQSPAAAPRKLNGEQHWLRTQRPLLHGVVILRGLPAREMGPNERPLPLGWARFLSLIYGVVVYKVGPIHRSLGIVSNTCISFKLNNTRTYTHTHAHTLQEPPLSTPCTHGHCDTCLLPSPPCRSVVFVSWYSVLFILASQNRKVTGK